MKATLTVPNHIRGIEKLPLQHQLDAINLQLKVFEAVSKSKDLTLRGKIALNTAFLTVEGLKTQILVKMIAIKSTFSLN